MASTIITDVKGGTLKLTAARLIELTGGTQFYLPLKQFIKDFKTRTLGRFTTKIFTIKGSGHAFVTVFVPGEFSPVTAICYGLDVTQQGRIGCRTLTVSDFNKIVRAAKASVRKSRKTQTVAKAKGAAAGKAKRK